MLIHDGLAGGRALAGVTGQFGGVEGPGQHDGKGAIGNGVARFEGAIGVTGDDAVLDTAVNLLIGPVGSGHIAESGGICESRANRGHGHGQQQTDCREPDFHNIFHVVESSFY